MFNNLSYDDDMNNNNNNTREFNNSKNNSKIKETFSTRKLPLFESKIYNTENYDFDLNNLSNSKCLLFIFVSSLFRNFV